MSIAKDLLKKLPKPEHDEQAIAALAATALTEACQRALASGSSVLAAQDGKLIRILLNGEREFIRDLTADTPSIAVKPGRTYKLVLKA